VRSNPEASSADNTAGRQRGRPFEAGKSGNPAGRPAGARNKLSENFIRAVADDFERHGASVIERVRTASPTAYLRLISALIPQRLDLEGNLSLTPATKEQRDAAVAASFRCFAEEHGIELPQQGRA